MRILVIAHDEVLGAAIRQCLAAASHVVDVAAGVGPGLRMALGGSYALVLVDATLPRHDGWRAVRKLRRRHYSVPILTLSAPGAEGDPLHGLGLGADDDLSRAFGPAELLCCVRALLEGDGTRRTPVLCVADLQVDTGQCRVTRAGRRVHLTCREYALLEALAAREGQVLTREEIVERVWVDADAHSNMVDVYVATLRKKVDDGHAVPLIHTVRGAGYVLHRPDASDGA